MRRASEVNFKKVQDAAMDRLHRHQAGGRLKGFILPYLGMNDNTLPHTGPYDRRDDEISLDEVERIAI